MFRSRYLLAIVAIVGIYEIVSTVLDFEYTSAVVHLLPLAEQDAHFATVYNVTNIVSLTIQLFFTSFIMQRAGVRTALLFMPLLILGSFSRVPAVSDLWMGSALSISDNGLNYSLNQSAREAAVRPDHPGREVQGQGLHRHVRAALRQGARGRRFAAGVDVRLDPGQPALSVHRRHPAGGPVVVRRVVRGQPLQEVEEKRRREGARDRARVRLAGVRRRSTGAGSDRGARGRAAGANHGG